MSYHLTDIGGTMFEAYTDYIEFPKSKQSPS